MEPGTESSSYGATSSSSLTNSYCARLTSSSPPESFAYSYRLPLVARASSKSPRHCEPAVLTISDEVLVEDIRPPSPIAVSTSLPQTFAPSLPGSGSEEVSDLSCCCGTSWCVVCSDRRHHHRRPSLTRICSLLLGLSLLVFGGLIIPVSWFILLDVDSSSLEQQLHDDDDDGSANGGDGGQCRDSHARLQFAFIGQGLLLSLTGILLISCWTDDESTTSSSNTRQNPFNFLSLIAIVATVVSFGVLLGGLGFIVWQFVTDSVHCHWSPGVYALLVPLEGLAALISAVSTCIMTVLTFCKH